MTAIFSQTSFVLLFCVFGIVFGETEWVWSKNQSPHLSSSSGSKNNQNNFGSGSSSFPESPSRPSSQSNFQNSNLNNNGNLPAGSIRVVNSQGEPRLIPGAVNFITNALQGGSGGGGGGGGIGGGNGLISVGGGLLSSILSNGPQIASSALSFLLGRAPGNNNNNNGNNNGNQITTLPANVPSFPTIGGGGGGGGFPSSGISSNSGSCRCINLNQCFLPSRPQGGSCDGGNVMCCQTSSDTRAISSGDSSSLSSLLSNPTRNVRTPLDVRVGLIENIYRGSSSIIDDALDLVLQPFLTDEDKQKLATRVSNYG